MSRTLTALFSLGLLALAGCATAPPEQQPWEARRLKLETVQYWIASGKIALRTAEQAESASLLWQQLGKATHLRLSGPLGVSATTVDSDGRKLEIRQGEDYSRWDLDDPALGAEDGWDLPLRSLPHWLKGIPAPDVTVDHLVLDAAGQLPEELRQQGWTVRYQGFAPFENYLLPVRLQLEKGDTRARIIINSWQDLRDS